MLITKLKILRQAKQMKLEKFHSKKLKNILLSSSSTLLHSFLLNISSVLQFFFLWKKELSSSCSYNSFLSFSNDRFSFSSLIYSSSQIFSFSTMPSGLLKKVREKILLSAHLFFSTKTYVLMLMIIIGLKNVFYIGAGIALQLKYFFSFF